MLYDLDAEATRLPAIVRALHQDPVAAAIKIADRIEKLSSRCALPSDLERRYAMATMSIFVPIANRLGMWSAKRNLEDSVFGLLHPDEFTAIAERYGQDKRLAATEGLLKTARNHIEQAGIPAEVTLLPVSLYSLHRKLLQAEKSVPIYALTPLLILVDSTNACYVTMQILHQLWSPLTGQVWDYIAEPEVKPVPWHPHPLALRARRHPDYDHPHI